MSVVSIAETTLANGFLAGHGTIGTTEGKVSAVNFPIRKQLIIRAHADNTNVITIGRPGDANNGFILAAGETSPPIFVNETDKLALVGGAAGQNYSWMAI